MDEETSFASVLVNASPAGIFELLEGALQCYIDERYPHLHPVTGEDRSDEYVAAMPATIDDMRAFLESAPQMHPFLDASARARWWCAENIGAAPLPHVLALALRQLPAASLRDAVVANAVTLLRCGRVFGTAVQVLHLDDRKDFHDRLREAIPSKDLSALPEIWPRNDVLAASVRRRYYFQNDDIVFEYALKRSVPVNPRDRDDTLRLLSAMLAYEDIDAFIACALDFAHRYTERRAVTTYVRRPLPSEQAARIMAAGIPEHVLFHFPTVARAAEDASDALRTDAAYRLRDAPLLARLVRAGRHVLDVGWPQRPIGGSAFIDETLALLDADADVRSFDAEVSFNLRDTRHTRLVRAARLPQYATLIDPLRAVTHRHSPEESAQLLAGNPLTWAHLASVEDAFFVAHRRYLARITDEDADYDGEYLWRPNSTDSVNVRARVDAELAHLATLVADVEEHVDLLASLGLLFPVPRVREAMTPAAAERLLDYVERAPVSRRVCLAAHPSGPRLEFFTHLDDLAYAGTGETDNEYLEERIRRNCNKAVRDMVLYLARTLRRA